MALRAEFDFLFCYKALFYPLESEVPKYAKTVNHSPNLPYSHSFWYGIVPANVVKHIWWVLALSRMSSSLIFTNIAPLPRLGGGKATARFYCLLEISEEPQRTNCVVRGPEKTREIDLDMIIFLLIERFILLFIYRHNYCFNIFI